jgi:4'-phosphopantetheinyl transferase
VEQHFEPALSGCHVHVWHVDLEAVVNRHTELESWLTSDERLRADRFRFARHRRRFVAGRGALRFVLGKHINEHPRAVRITYGPHGRPELDAKTQVRFNLAHSGDRAVIAVSEAVPIGIDIEAALPIPDADTLASLVFSADELRQLAAAADKSDAFLRGWTRKEAFLKALGTGLGGADDVCSVSLAEPAFLEVRPPHGPTGEWTLRDLSDAGAVIALAVRARDATVEVRRADLT